LNFYSCQSSSTVPTNTEWTEGYGLAATRAEALHQAQEDAIAKRIGVYISGSTVVQNSQVTYNEIRAFLKGGIKESRIKSEGQKEGKYFVLLEAKVVDDSEFEKCAKWIITNIGRPVTLVITRETQNGKSIPSNNSAAQTALVKAFSAKGIPRSNEKTMKELAKERPKLMQELTDGKFDSATSFAFTNGASVLLFADAECRAVSNSGKEDSDYTAQVSFTAIHAFTGQILAQSKENRTVTYSAADPVRGCDVSVRSAAETALQDTVSSPGLITQLLKSWSDGSDLVLQVTGLTLRDGGEDLMAMIKEDYSVKSGPEISGSAGNVLILNLQFAGSPTTFLTRVLTEEKLTDNRLKIIGEPIIRPGNFALRMAKISQNVK
jgi:hypothetical protein